MAPTLKEVNPVDSSAPAGVVAPGAGAGEEVARESNSAMANSTNTNDTVTEDQGNRAAPTASSPAEQKITASMKMSMSMMIEREDPAEIPDDESAFLVAPHFDKCNPFHRNLSTLDLCMRCAICSDFYRAPVTLLPCLHNFCSLCIRNHFKHTHTGMKRKADCPQCNKPVKTPGSTDYEKGIMPNKQLEQQVDNYIKCRDELRKKLVRLDVLEKEKGMGPLAMTRSDKDDGIIERSGNDDETNNRGTKRGKGKDVNGSRSSKRGRRAVANRTSYESDVESDEDDENDEDYVYDPSNFKNRAASSNEVGAKQPPLLQLRRKTKVSYHGMNKKKLVELCRKEGLNTQGGEKELKQRHSDYITLYNAECDSEHPRSIKELLKEMKNREMAIKTEAKKVTTKKSSKFMANLGNSLDSYHEGSIRKPSSGNAEFDAKMNNGFADLIANVKNRKAGRVPNTSNDGGDNKMEVKSSGDAQVNGGDGFHGVASLNAKESEGPTSTSSSQKSAGFLEKRNGDVNVNGMDNNFDSIERNTAKSPSRKMTNVCGDATSPSVSMDSDSDKTVSVGTPQQSCGKNNFEQKSTSSPSKVKAVFTKPAPHSSAKKSKSLKGNRISRQSPCVTRISDLGPWICTTCTYQNLRNTTRKAKCEMCNMDRPEVSAASSDGDSNGMEVVNIDC